MREPDGPHPRGLIVAIDGPSGAGKSTAGRALAERLNYVFLDTGAMYRALALAALRSGLAADDEVGLARLASGLKLGLERDGTVLLAGEDVTAAVRSREVTLAASRVAAQPEVRRQMVALQREMGKQGGVVLDGRDIGTAVFPNAEVKFFLDADPARRALRRHAELAASGTASDPAAIERELRERDRADSTRADSPLVRAPDAILLDTTLLGPEEVVERMLATVEAKAATA
ncbi:MAG TPA: (d)CMP kinase [Vicinamibacteria bacterium]|nr:(d)CMP kinase [Vicinamibacteria bacterium]